MILLLYAYFTTILSKSPDSFEYRTKNITAILLPNISLIGFSPSAMAKMSKEKYVSLEVVYKICEFFNAQTNDIIEFIPIKETQSKTSFQRMKYSRMLWISAMASKRKYKYIVFSIYILLYL